MERFTVISPMGVTLSHGRAILSPAQARDRLHCLKPLGGDLYEIIHPTMLKKGEEFGYDAPMNKSLVDVIEPIAETAPEADPALDEMATFENLLPEHRLLVITEEIKKLIGVDTVDGPEGPINAWTRDGKPSVPALEALLGDSITAKERDEAFALLEKPKE